MQSKLPARFGGGRTHAPQRCDGVYPTPLAALKAEVIRSEPKPQKALERVVENFE